MNGHSKMVSTPNFRHARDAMLRVKMKLFCGIYESSCHSVNRSSCVRAGVVSSMSGRTELAGRGRVRPLAWSPGLGGRVNEWCH